MFLDRLPKAEMYERSFMHRDTLSLVAVTKTDFIITASTDGHLKFWKKTETGLEFVKHFRSHLGSIIGMAVSSDGTLLATIATDKTLKIYDVINFDMINMLKLDYPPRAVCWTFQSGKAQALVAVSDYDSSTIRIYDSRAEPTPVFTSSSVHAKSVTLIKYNEAHDCVVSIDQGGIVEYWQPNEQFSLPSTVAWQYKTDTDLYEFVKSKSVPVSLEFSHDCSLFVTMSMDDRQVRVFRFITGRLHRKYDESLAVASEMQQAGTAVHRPDDMEFGRLMAVEKELQSSSAASFANAVFDDSGNFILYPTLLGVKVVNLVSNKVSMIIGKGETTRFLNIALYQGSPKKKVAVTLVWHHTYTYECDLLNND
jgi:peptidylprolyl isomerase domain and WD repeat-containing protein 1